MESKLCDVNSIHSEIISHYSKSKIKAIGGVPVISGLNLYKIWRDRRNKSDVRVIRTCVDADIELRGFENNVVIELKLNKVVSTNLKRAINHVTYDKTMPKKSNKMFAEVYKQVTCSTDEVMYDVIEEIFNAAIKDYMEIGQ